MKTMNKNNRTSFAGTSPAGSSNKCRSIRNRLYEAVSNRFDMNANWIRDHIANCPRCRRRLVSIGKVNLALSALKSQPHKLDLLMRANTQAIGVLKHSLRREPKAEKLRAMLPEPRLLERCSRYSHSAANVAACIVILFLMKIGVFSSMDKFQSQSKKAVRQYYTTQVGEDLADEIFTA